MSESEQLLYGKKEAAELLGISFQTLDRMTKSGTGPRPSKIGSRVLFAREELQRFASQTVSA